MQVVPGPGTRFRDVEHITDWFQEARSINIKMNWAK